MLKKKNIIVFHNYKKKIVTGEMIEREKEKCHVYDERKSPTSTTLSVYNIALQP